MQTHTDFVGAAVAGYRATVLGIAGIVAVETGVVADNQSCRSGIPDAVVETQEGPTTKKYQGSVYAQGLDHSKTGCWTSQLENRYTCSSITNRDERTPRQSC